MLKKTALFLSFFLYLHTSIFSQEGGAVVSSGNKFSYFEKPDSSQFAWHPYIGVGVGMLSYFGDIYDKHFQSPTVSRISYDVTIGQKLNKFLYLNLTGLRGKVEANERFAADHRNLNFQSQITSGGINLVYNFGNFLPSNRIISPYISLGAEAFKFESKTDLLDEYGNTYYYWDDGTIRNLPHTDPNFQSATTIKRDYVYETDIRTLNADGFGNYPDIAYGFPVGAGFTAKFNDNLSFKMGASMHFTTTDYIDGITTASIGNRAGNSRNDKFMYTSFSLTYTFWHHHNEMKEADQVALDKMDDDKDGVVDVYDDCPCTPKNIPVNGHGCPYDDDKDGVPNYRDDEAATPSNLFVDEHGVRMSDSLWAYQMNEYLDSTGAFQAHEIHNHDESTAYKYFYSKEFMVSLGTFVKSVPTSTMVKLLDIKDVESNVFSNKITMYTSGNFASITDAELRKQQLIAYGMPNAKVVYRQHGEFHDPAMEKKRRSNNNTAPANNTVASVNKAINNTSANNKSAPILESQPPAAKTVSSEDNPVIKKYAAASTMTPEIKAAADKINIAITDTKSPLVTKDIVLTVQLGAFSEKLSEDAFEEIKDLIETEMDDGLFKYTCGVYQDYPTALNRKNEMIPKGYENAFVTAYQEGRRIPLAAAGAPPATGDEPPPVQHTLKKNLAPDAGVVFKIQVGKFKKGVSIAKFNELNKIENLVPEEDTDGYTRYVVGSFTNYDNAKDFKKQLVKRYNLKDAFMIAEKNGEVMTVKDALKLYAQ